MIGLLQCDQHKSPDLLDTVSTLREALENFIEQKESKADRSVAEMSYEEDINLLSLEGISDEKQILEVDILYIWQTDLLKYTGRIHSYRSASISEKQV